MGEKRGAREGEAGDGVGGTPCGPGEGACRGAICIHLYLEARPVDRLKGAPGLEIQRPQGKYRAEMGSSQSGEGGHRGGRAPGARARGRWLGCRCTCASVCPPIIYLSVCPGLKESALPPCSAGRRAGNAKCRARKRAPGKGSPPPAGSRCVCHTRAPAADRDSCRAASGPPSAEEPVATVTLSGSDGCTPGPGSQVEGRRGTKLAPLGPRTTGQLQRRIINGSSFRLCAGRGPGWPEGTAGWRWTSASWPWVAAGGSCSGRRGRCTRLSAEGLRGRGAALTV